MSKIFEASQPTTEALLEKISDLQYKVYRYKEEALEANKDVLFAEARCDELEAQVKHLKQMISLLQDFVWED